MENFSLLDVFSNLTVFPLGLTVYFPFLVQYPLIGQAGSLSNELIFYLLVPLIFTSNRIILIGSIISIIVFSLATMSYINTSGYSYNNLPGPFIFFVVGHLIYKQQWGWGVAALTALAVNMAYVILYKDITAGFNTEIYLGLGIGVLLILFLKDMKPNKLDNLAGAISYGCFLGHGVILVPFRYYNLFEDNLFLFSTSILSLSILMGYVSYKLVEEPTLRYRRKWRF